MAATDASPSGRVLNDGTGGRGGTIFNPLLAGLCLAVCVFSTIVTLFFGDWVPVRDQEFACWVSMLISNYRNFLDDAVFVNMFLMTTACFAGLVFAGVLKWKVGAIPLVVALCFGLLYFIGRLPSITGLYFLPSFLYWPVAGNASIKDIPYYIWFLLTFVTLPIIYFIDALMAKTVPVWKIVVLILAPFSMFFFMTYSFVRVGMSGGSFRFVMSRGLTFWILIGIVIFSELIRQKAKKVYVWLSVALAGSGAVLGLIVVGGIALWIYRYVDASKNGFAGRADDPCLYYRNR
jgi:hypothetical protein